MCAASRLVTGRENHHMKTLYTVKGYKGAHILEDVRDTESGTIADVHLVGAVLPFSVPAADVVPFTHAEAMPKGYTVEALAQEAVTVYGLDPARVQRAADLFRQPKAVQLAHRDELDEQITPSLNVIIVKGSKGWYLTRRNFCQCADNTKGNTCKHRIAAWMYRESTVRPLAVARNRKPAEILAELTA